MRRRHLLPMIATCLGALGCARLAVQSTILPTLPRPTPSFAVPTPTLGPGPASHQLSTTLHDVEFCAPDGIPLAMDLYFPEQADGPVPAVIFVHGGGWTSGDKRAGAGIAGPELVLSGYMVASVNYRLAPDHPFPAQIEDVKCAVRFLRAHAAALGIDPERIGAYGSSAGGHLVSLLGLAGPDVGLDGDGGWADQSSEVQAVVNLYGPTDLAAMCTESRFRAVFRAVNCQDAALGRASPVSYVRAAAPPFLIIQGTQDIVVPMGQAQILADQLAEVGAPVSLLLVEHAGHGFKPVDGDPDPSRTEIVRRIVEFFDSTLHS